MPLEVIRHPVNQLQYPRIREHIAPVSSGFHVSLRGTFGPSSRLTIAYAAFSYMGKNIVLTPVLSLHNYFKNYDFFLL